MSLAYQHIKRLCLKKKRPMISPFSEKQLFDGKSYGCSHAGYDIRIAQDVTLYPITLWNLIWNALPYKLLYLFGYKKRLCHSLASTIEYFDIPKNLQFTIADKSSWAREWLTVQNTVGEPGWCGYLTLELINHGQEIIHIKAGSPIAQMIFYRMSAVTEFPYDGKYQNQENRPVPAIFEQ